MTTTLATLARNQRERERKVAREIAKVRQWMEDERNVPTLLRDAIKFRPDTLAMPVHYERFMKLVTDTEGDLL
jgi:hypothetical protein